MKSDFHNVPGGPLLRWPFVSSSGILKAPTRPWLSYGRHALLHYLEFVSSSGKKPVRKILLPDYMCIEVIDTLKRYGYEIGYYPLEDPFEINEDLLEKRLDGFDAVLLCHFYGRFIRNLHRICRICRDRGLTVIEDCTHLPFPYHPYDAPCRQKREDSLDEPFVSDMKLYTFRKLYALPYGATAVVKGKEEEFNAFLAGQVEHRQDTHTAGLVFWLFREGAKRLVHFLSIPVRRTYRDISLDPLKDFNFAHPLVERMVGKKDWIACVKRRRENYRLYLHLLAGSIPWVAPVDLGGEDDVPYQLVLCIKEEIDCLALIRYFLHNGVAAQKGMALHPDVLDGLPPHHRYHRYLTLPLHQDVGKEGVAYAVRVLKRYAESHGAQMNVQSGAQ